MAKNGFIHAVGYGAWIIKEIFSAGFSTIIAAFKPHAGIRPIMILYPLRLTTDWERFWFSSSITATPGTMSLGFRHDPKGTDLKFLLVQAAFGEDPIEQIQGLIEMEERVAPRIAATPLDPATVEWYEYHDYGPDPKDTTLPAAERLD
ncbi:MULTISPECIES: monovalent cation/H+ antiporter subunit E [unclassified Corynebacterium]|uniref:monovalent cation/H+ antiporter subunit E n=1 Tax=unclassified Corynebacterium TaxID=2624378 RepID=UPI002A914ECF|nr:monovalent cation/H+ antiporter subunit E [Corynebacterium sp.]MDY5785418.1 monovalent cation/H+ antiporter subunit E [Corynebacterium sp.]